MSVLLQKNQEFSFDYSSWFGCSYDEADCHQDCCSLTFQLYQGACGFTVYDSSKYTFDAANKIITINTQTGFELDQICLRGTSYGHQKIDTIMSVEVCGTETISLSKYSQISELYERITDKSRFIEISSAGYSFQTDRENCPVSTFKIFEGTQEYLGTDLILRGSERNNDLKLEVSISNPLDFSIEIFGFSRSGDSFDSFSINIFVCGYEEITFDQPSFEKLFRMNIGSQLIL